MTEIRTERLVLRHLRDKDAPVLAKAADNYEIARWLGLLPHPYTIDDAIWFINSNKGQLNQAYGIFHERNFIGIIGTDGLLGLGYWLAQDAWGNGFMTEAAVALINEHFKTQSSDDMQSVYIVGNLGSARIQEKLGFEISGRKSVKRKYFGETEQIQTILTRERWKNETILTLRPLAESDWRKLQVIAGNDDVAPMLASVRSPWAELDVKQWIAMRHASTTYGILNKGELVGVVSAGGKPMSVMYFLDKAYWGQGITTKAVLMALKKIFADTKVNEINSGAFHDNPASIRILEKCGFEKVGESTKNSGARVEPVPVFLYRLTREQFESANS